MSDVKTPGDKPLSMPTGKLSIKRPAEQGTVRQSFSHGRSKTVVVEKVKRRDATPPAQSGAPKRVVVPPAGPRPAAALPRLPRRAALRRPPLSAARLLRPLPLRRSLRRVVPRRPSCCAPSPKRSATGRAPP